MLVAGGPGRMIERVQFESAMAELVTTDAMIIDLRTNGGGGGGGVGRLLASYFMGPEPAPLTGVFWRSSGETIPARALTELPAGAALWLDDGNGTSVQGPYTRIHRNVEGGLWTAVVLGDELVSVWAWRTGSDFALLLLDATPDPLANVYYSGWDVTGSIPLGSVGIHHPSGGEKAISFNDDALLPIDYYGFGGHQWEVDQWELGTTEGGSSGSCIYDPTSRLCVGTLTGGAASCFNPAGYDIYGRMDVHWTGDGTASGRLSDWLDPLGTGDLTLGGRDSDSPIFSDGFESGDMDFWSVYHRIRINDL